MICVGIGTRSAKLNPPGTILGIPLWCEEGVYLTADAAIGATSLSVSSVNFIDWRSEGVLWKFDDSACEGIQIEGISGTTITLSSALQSAFKAGDQVLPLMRGFQVEDYAEDTQSPEISDLSLTFVEDLARVGAPSISGALNSATYLGLPVLPLVTEWSEPPKPASVRERTSLRRVPIARHSPRCSNTFASASPSHRL